jgi:CRISPR-associated exonuclease Cas4
VPDHLPISALQHLLYCERQCALIHLDREWTENRFTAEGRVLHERAHEGPSESRPGVRITRGLSVSSDIFGLTGQCDIVEFHRDGRIVPVEYKRGKPKTHRADEVQLCAQALCLEEMLSSHISQGFLFYGQNRRRTTVEIDAGLRDLTISLASRLRDIIASEALPPAVYDRRKCSACSLLGECQPQNRKSAADWFDRFLTETLSPSMLTPNGLE